MAARELRILVAREEFASAPGETCWLRGVGGAESPLVGVVWVNAAVAPEPRVVGAEPEAVFDGVVSVEAASVAEGEPPVPLTTLRSPSDETTRTTVTRTARPRVRREAGIRDGGKIARG